MFPVNTNNTKKTKNWVSNYKLLESDPSVSKQVFTEFSNFSALTPPRKLSDIALSQTSHSNITYSDGFKKIQEHIADTELFNEYLDQIDKQPKVSDNMKAKKKNAFISMVRMIDNNAALLIEGKLTTVKGKVDYRESPDRSEAPEENDGEESFKQLKKRRSPNDDKGGTRGKKFKIVKKTETHIPDSSSLSNHPPFSGGHLSEVYKSQKTDQKIRLDIDFVGEGKEDVAQYKADIRKGIPFQIITWAKPLTLGKGESPGENESEIVIREKSKRGDNEGQSKIKTVGISMKDLLFPPSATSLVYYHYQVENQEKNQNKLELRHDLPKATTCLLEYEKFRELSSTHKVPSDAQTPSDARSNFPTLKTFYEMNDDAKFDDKVTFKDIYLRMPTILARSLISDFKTARGNNNSFISICVPSKELYLPNQSEKNFNSQLRFHFKPNDSFENLCKASEALSGAIQHGLDHIRSKEAYRAYLGTSYVNIKPQGDNKDEPAYSFSMHKACFPQEALDHIKQEHTLPPNMRIEKGRVCAAQQAPAKVSSR